MSMERYALKHPEGYVILDIIGETPEHVAELYEERYLQPFGVMLQCGCKIVKIKIEEVEHDY